MKNRTLKYVLSFIITTIICGVLFWLLIYLLKVNLTVSLIVSISLGIVCGAISSVTLFFYERKMAKIKEDMENYLSAIESEKAKVGFVLNNMPQGMVVIKENGEISLINKKVANMFGHDYKELLNLHYEEVFDDLQLVECIKNSLDGQEVTDFELLRESHTYRLVFNNIGYSRGGKPFEDLKLAIVFTDVSDLKDANVMKQLFISNASHELKNPLAAIIGYLQLISCGLVNNLDEMKEYASLTYKEAMRMDEIIKDMLVLSRLEGHMDEEKSPVNLIETLNEVMDSLALKIKNKNLNISIKVKATTVEMGQNHAYSLISNLISNAIKYSLDSGKIEIHLSPTKFEVVDHGIGISKADISKIFNRFYRSYGVLSQEGSGLGLAIVKHICEIYGFKISVKSNLNKGSHFTVTF